VIRRLILGKAEGYVPVVPASSSASARTRTWADQGSLWDSRVALVPQCGGTGVAGQGPGSLTGGSSSPSLRLLGARAAAP
jgi:hypothetical protein